MSSTKQLLIEVPKEEVVKEGLIYASKTNYKNWSNMDLLLHISQVYHFINEPNEITILKEAMNDVWTRKSEDTKCKPCVVARAISLRSHVSNVLKSRPATLLIEVNMVKQSEASAKNRLTTHITDQIGVSSNVVNSSLSDTSSSGTNIALSSMTEASSSAADRSLSSSIKRRKRIMPEDFKGLNKYEQACLLIDTCGTNKILDYRQNLIIPQRLQNITNRIMKRLHLLLITRLKGEEYSLLKQISDTTSIYDLAKTVENIGVIQSSDELIFIKMMISKLVILYKHDHLKKEHNESWYRVNVYSDAFDLLFLISNLFESKRAECESVIIKTLKELKELPANQKNCRLDFILESNSNDRFFEQLFCEDKPVEKKSETDIEKADLVRSSTLKYWSTLLPYKECLNYIESTSCHFNKLTLHIYGAKLIGDYLIHYVKKETSIPNNGSGSQLADYIVTILSLFRHVLINLKKIKIMCEIALQDDLTYLKNTPLINTFREDSPDLPSQSSQSSSESSINSSTTKEWEIQERKDRIMDKIKTSIKALEEAEYNENVKDCWEELQFPKD